MKLLFTHFMPLPAADENEAADILVQQEGYPHAADTPAREKRYPHLQLHSTAPPTLRRVVDILPWGVGEDVDRGGYFSTSMIRMVAPIRMMSGLDVSQPKMACPKGRGCRTA